MKKDYLLTSKTAIQLYNEYAKDLPVIDFHNHISVDDIKLDRRFKNITELWIASDPYKHRLMRISGVDEYYITGNATDYEKFEKFAKVFPLLVGTPVYDWSRMELSQIFGIDELLCEESAASIYERANKKLTQTDFSNNEILKRFNIEYQSPVFLLTDAISDIEDNTLAPSLRGDNLLSPDEKTKKILAEKSGIEIADEDSYFKAISVLLGELHCKGCRFADHALDDGFFENSQKREYLIRLAGEYSKLGWTLLLHLGAKRKTSDRLRRVAGAAGGYAAVGNSFDVTSLCDTLGDMECRGGLPKTVLFPLNMSDIPAMSVLSGSFSEDGVAAKIQLGPAWWWCDHYYGIRSALDSVASFGVLSQFIGMTTDSRSILSFVRHDYFRRIFCSWLAEKNEGCGWDLNIDMLGNIVRKICYENAKERIK